MRGWLCTLAIDLRQGSRRADIIELLACKMVGVTIDTAGDPRDARTLLESLPFPAALWSGDHHSCAFNRLAREFLGFSESDFLRESSLRIDRIHPDDREGFLSAWRRAERGAGSASCRYRFLPGGSSEPIGVCEHFYSYRLPDQTAPAVWSVYSRESCGHAEALERRQVRVLFEGLGHEISNSLQAIRGEFDLLSLSGLLPAGNAATIHHDIERICELINEACDFLAPPALDQGRENAATVVQEVIRAAAPQLEKLGICVSVGGQGSLPQVAVGLHFREALRRVVQFSSMLLSQGGELTVEAIVKRTGLSSQLGVRVVYRSRTRLDVEEGDIFRPYVKVDRHRLGLALSIARQMVRRHFGDIVFEKQQDNRGAFSMFIPLPTEHSNP